MTGYASAFLLLPIHVITPASSELGYEYVKTTFHGWIRSTVLYAALVLGVTLHATDAIGIIWATWAQRWWRSLPGRRGSRARRHVTSILGARDRSLNACNKMQFDAWLCQVCCCTSNTAMSIYNQHGVRNLHEKCKVECQLLLQ